VQLQLAAVRFDELAEGVLVAGLRPLGQVRGALPLFRGTAPDARCRCLIRPAVDRKVGGRPWEPEPPIKAGAGPAGPRPLDVEIRIVARQDGGDSSATWIRDAAHGKSSDEPA
jgi:hypothetical protein